MISCEEAVGLTNKIGTCWNVAIQTNLFYGHNSEIVQRKLNEQSLEQILNPTVIENLEKFLPPFLVDHNGKLLQRTLDLIKKIVINLKKRFDIKNKQKITKMQNAEEDVCERDFVYYVMELIYPGERNKEDTEKWGGNHESSFFLTNILDIILLNKLTHIVHYYCDHLSKGNKISLNIDKIKSIELYVHESYEPPLDITDLTKTLTEKKTNHACQFFECDGTTKFSNNSTIIEHDWRMFFKILNMLCATDYETQKNDSGLTVFSEYDTTPNPLPKYEVWQNLEIGPYIVTYDSELKPSIMYTFSPFFKKEKIINHRLILAEGQVREFHFSYNISCTPENIKKLVGLDFAYYLSLKMMRNNKIVMLQRLFDLMDVNVINKDKETIVIKGLRSESTMFVIEALKRINKTTLNYQDKDGQTALMKAVLKKNLESIKQIMKYEPDITLKDKNGLTALDHATELEIDFDDLNTYELPDFIEELEKLQKENPPNLFELTVLLDAYRNINETDVDGNTLLMHSVINNKHLEIVKEVLKQEPDLSIRNLHGHTALDIAKILNKQDVIKLLEEYVSKAVNVKPPLLKPISTFNKELDLTTEQLQDLIQEIKILQRKSSPNLDDFHYFLDLLKDINETDYHGNTLLMHSVINNKHLDIVKEVLKQEPDLSIRNLQGYTALDIATILNKQDVIKLLEEYASKPVNVKPIKEQIKEPIKQEVSKEFLKLRIALKQNDLESIRLLIDWLKDINETDNQDWTILMHVAEYKKNIIEIVKAILKKNPDLSIKNLQGQTALDLAKLFNNTDMVQLLEIYSSKPVNVRPVNVKPIIKEESKDIILELQEAIIADNLNLVKTLLDSLKDINQVNPGGWTIFHFIVFGNYNLEILKEILKRNPDLSIKTPRGETTLELAKRRERTEMIEVLENYISRQVNVRPANANVRPKGRNEKCDEIDKLTVNQINEVFKEIKQPIPAASLGRLQRLQMLKDLLGC